MDMPQNITIENRIKTKISGVQGVINFNDDTVSLMTNLGGLIVKGKELHINKLNTDDGELIIQGTILSLTYTNKEGLGKGKSILSKIFK